MGDDIARYNETFAAEQASVRQLLARHDGDIPAERGLDPEIRALVGQLNTLPFLYTRWSCAGHMTTREDVLRVSGTRGQFAYSFLLQKEECHFVPGYLGLVLRSDDQRAGSFMEGLLALVSRHENASIDYWPPLIDTSDPSLQSLAPQVNFESQASGNPYQGSVVPFNEGIRKIASNQAAIRDFEDLVLQYAEKVQAVSV